MRRINYKLCVLLVLIFGGMSQPALALKCIGYVSVNGGEFMCAGYAETHPCERADQSCLPIPPRRLPSQPSNPGAPPAGPSPAANDVLPEDMSCKQLSQQIKAQEGIIAVLDTDTNRANNEIAVAERNLSGVLSEAAVNTAKATAEAACTAWSNLLATDPDFYVCTEPRPGKPPKCKLRALKPNERQIKNNCDAKNATAASLNKSRTEWLAAEKVNRAILASAQRKKAIAQKNLDALRNAKRAKPECQ